MDFLNGKLLKSTFYDLAISLSRTTDPSWKQVQILCHFLPQLPQLSLVNSPITPTNFQAIQAPNFTPFLVTDQVLLSFESISLFLTQTNSKFSDELFHSLISILQNAPISQFSNSEHSSIAYFFKQSVARIRWIAEECKNLSLSSGEILEIFSKIISQLYEKLVSNRDQDVTMATIAMLIGIYEGISVKKEQIRTEIENSGIEISNMELTLDGAPFRWSTSVGKEDMQHLVDKSLAIVEYCRENVVPNGFQIDFSTYNLQPVIYRSLSHLLSNPPQNESTQKLKSCVLSELTQLISSYREIKPGQELKYYNSFHSRFSALMRLSVTLLQTGVNWDELCDILIDTFEIKLKHSLDNFQFGIRIETMLVLTELVNKMPTCRVSIFDVIMGQLESSFMSRVCSPLKNNWSSLKLPELDQIPTESLIRKDFNSQHILSFEEYFKVLTGLCVACQGGQIFEAFIGQLASRLISIRLEDETNILQYQLIVNLLIRLSAKLNLVSILQALKGHISYSNIHGGFVLYETSKVSDYDPSVGLILRTGDFLLDVIGNTKNECFRDLAKNGISNLMKFENIQVCSNFALKSFEKLVSSLAECLEVERNARGKELEIIYGWLGIVSQCVAVSGCIGDTNDLRVLALFRDFWLSSVVLDLVSSSIHLKSLQTIASCTPIFLNKNSSNFFAFLKSSSLSDKSHMPKPLVAQLRHNLVQLLENTSDISSRIQRLDSIQLTFLIALYNIEIMRLQYSKPKLPTILFYCENRVIQHISNEFHKVLCIMANQILGKGVAIKAAQVPPTLAHNMELELYAIMLIPRLCTLDHSVRDIACSTLYSLLNQFEYLLLNLELIFTIFSIHSLLYYSLRTARGKPISHQEPIKIPNTDFVLNLPDTFDKKRNIFRYFEGEMRRFFKSSFEYSYRDTLAVLQGFFINYDTSEIKFPGMSIAINIFSQSDYMETVLDPVLAPCDSVLGLNYPFENSQKFKTFGKVNSEMKSREFLPNLLRSLDQSDLIISSESAVCYLAITKDLTKGILEKMFLNLVQNFNLKTVSSVLNNFDWLIGVSPGFESEIFKHSCQLILATKDRNQGIFAEYEFKNDRVTFVKGPLVYEEVLAHREIIIFIHNRYQILKNKNSFETEILLNIMSSILGLFLGIKGVNYQPIIPLPSTVGVTFRILNICLDILDSKSIPENFDTFLLRKRIFITALHFFSFESEWPTHSLELLRNDIGMLTTFWSRIKNDNNQISDSSSFSTQDFLDMDEILITRESSSTCVSPDLPIDFPTQRSHSFSNIYVDSTTKIVKNSKSTNWSRRSFLSAKSGKSNRSSQKFSPPLSYSEESVYETNNEKYSEFLLLEKHILILILHSELLKLNSWLDPLHLYKEDNKHDEEFVSFSPPPFHKKIWVSYVQYLWQLSPYLALQTLKRLRVPFGSNPHSELVNFISKQPTLVIESGSALELFLTKTKIESDRNDLSYILFWQKPSLIFALTLFTPQYPRHVLTAQLSYSVLLTSDLEHLIFYIPQIVQSLRSDELGFVWHSIIGAARKSQLFTHQIVWNMKTNMFTDEHSEIPDEQLHDTLEKLITVILSNLSGMSLEFYQREFEFFKKVTGISGQIRDIPIGPARDQACLERFSLIQPEVGVYLPSNPECAVVGIDHESAKPMQSAEKAPFRAQFKVKKFNLEDLESMNQSNSLLQQIKQDSDSIYWQSCIFKVGDDIRQDMLALQIMSLFKNVLEKAGLELFFKPYKVVCTEPGCGIIECVPNAISRDQLGRKTDTNLFDYFIATFGDVLSENFKVARLNFIKSLAAYSIFSFLIQIKDRHNGNILITNEGYIIHIDFGFMFESSPGGNLGFEPHVKLTEEMLLIMGGDVNAAPYTWFRELCVRGYLALRPFCDEVVRMVNLMLDTKLPCFRGNTIEPLRTRFSPGASEKHATQIINKVIDDSLLNLRTKGYDMLQKLQNNIAS
ncbi:hypothetical protein LOD99_11596 [Oopsacas minuta]|uniref:1-phosphatidylinositol 4-kinase n=1 Tax=Oopsacas minuta TaxID=111878 RepID=A0AAV7JK47_9METZ|nr:hypothetical protein LOD99_11596 [Oopsacas minuta]